MKKILGLSFLLVLFALAGLSQPELPHRVYGNVTDSGQPVEGVNVTFRDGEGIKAEGSTNQNGIYDVDINSAEDESVYLFLDSQNTSLHVNFTSGASEMLSYSGTFSDGSNNEDNTSEDDDSDSGGGGSGGGSGGGGSASSGDGGIKQPDTDEQPEKIEIVTELENGSSEVDIGDLEANQQVEVSVLGESSALRGYKFTSQEETEGVYLELNSLEEVEGVQSPQGEVWRYFSTNLTGIDSYSNAELSYRVSKSWLLERDREKEDTVLMKREEGWERRDYSEVAETLSSISYSAEVSQGLLSVVVPKESEARDIEIKEFNVEQKGLEEVNITAKVVNSYNSSVNDSVTLYQESTKLKTWEIYLQPGEERELSFTRTFRESGFYRFSIGDKTKEIQLEQSKPVGNTFIVFATVGGVILVLAAGLLAYIYLIEYRRAKELDNQVESIQQQTERVGSSMKKIRGDLNRLQEQFSRKKNQSERDNSE